MDSSNSKGILPGSPLDLPQRSQGLLWHGKGVLRISGADWHWKGEIGDDNNPLLAAIGFCHANPKDSFGKASLPQRSQGLLWRMPLAWGGHPLGNLRSKYNQIAEKVQRWLQTILCILNAEMASAQGKNQNFCHQAFKLTF